MSPNLSKVNQAEKKNTAKPYKNNVSLLIPPHIANMRFNPIYMLRKSLKMLLSMVRIGEKTL